MSWLFEAKIGSTPVMAILLATFLVWLDAMWALRVYRYKSRTHLKQVGAANEPLTEQRARRAGLLVGGFARTVMLGSLGFLALMGSQFALGLFVVGVVWRGVGPTRRIVQAAASGFTSSSGTTRGSLVVGSIMGAAFFFSTRVFPLVALTASLRAA
jgi:hypothetical protein